MGIGGPDGDQNPCIQCNGTGEIDGEFHYLCLGTGKTGGYALTIFLKTFYDDVMDKLDAIIAEQASQREDLTAALTQIWDKVKDL